MKVTLGEVAYARPLSTIVHYQKSGCGLEEYSKLIGRDEYNNALYCTHCTQNLKKTQNFQIAFLIMALVYKFVYTIGYNLHSGHIILVLDFVSDQYINVPL